MHIVICVDKTRNPPPRRKGLANGSCTPELRVQQWIQTRKPSLERQSREGLRAHAHPPCPNTVTQARETHPGFCYVTFHLIPSIHILYSGDSIYGSVAWEPVTIFRVTFLRHYSVISKSFPLHLGGLQIEFFLLNSVSTTKIVQGHLFLSAAAFGMRPV